MKKALSLLLATVLLLSLLPTPTYAAESDSSVREQWIQLACEAFPEYEDNIRGTVSTYSRTIVELETTPEVVFCETREISETETVTYAQYSDGRSIIIGGKAAARLTAAPTQSNFAGGIDYTITYTVVPTDTDNFDGIFQVIDFKCRVMPATYDSILNIGTPSVNYSSICKYNVYPGNLTETASSPANVNYSITFYPNYATSDYRLIVSLDLSVSNDDVSAIIS